MVGARLVGTNTVESTLNGCAVLEHWRDVEGGEGSSLFYYDRSADRWKQVWVTDQALYPGGMKEKVEQIEQTSSGRLRFQGRHRTTLTREADGKVRQLIESTPDGGKTWRATFDALYQPSSSAAAAACSSSRDAVAAAPLLLIDNKNRRDIEAVLAGYTEDAVWLSPDQPVVRGRSNFRPRYEALFRGNRLAYSAEISEAHADGSLGYAWGKIRGTSTPRISVAAAESGSLRAARWPRPPT
jgi:ketosteroid isomerase-like protein